MPRRRATPNLSIAIEWKNAQFAALAPTRRMLPALRVHLIGLDRAPPPPREIVVLDDRRTIDGEVVARVVAGEIITQVDPGIVPRMLKV